jgi:hypothetical protein
MKHGLRIAALGDAAKISRPFVSENKFAAMSAI